MQMARLISVLSVVVDEQLHDLQTEDLQDYTGPTAGVRIICQAGNVHRMCSTFTEALLLQHVTCS